MHQGPPIVAEKLARLARNSTFRRIMLATTLPFVSVVAAFGIAPDTVTEKVELTRVVEEVALPALSIASATDESYWREERIQRSDTVGSVLTRLNVEDANAVRFLRTSADAKGLRQLVPGRVVRASATEDGRLQELRYSLGVTMLTVKPEGDGFRVREEVAPLERRIVMKSGEIKSSLFAATDAAQLTDAVADQMAQVFSTDIDFHKDLRRGDRFTVVYEMYYDAGEPVRSGRMLAAEFVNEGKPYQAIWFERANGQGDYYALDGKPIKKAFLRSPLEFSRISSGFTTARFHPVLQRWRAHTGVDYAAATGTGVKATSDGIVEFAGQKGGYGNVVILRHQKRYTTLYGHLSGFGRGIHDGARVSQGDVIGYVGMTGLATGPHLHYEFRIDDVYQDPLTVAMPDALPITADYRTAFDAVAQPMGLRLGLLRNTNLARLQ
ncbi:MAG: peptidase [Betaproteobacteria bacterium]|jgi:murein DD-endopeptidase MepM/ murein hydrolase activator NlpD|nr:peptidase [Betaproteobacteria bacterium]